MRRYAAAEKHLFENVEETPRSDVPEIEPIVEQPQKESAGRQSENSRCCVTGIVPPIDEPKTLVALKKKAMNKVVFGIPVVILLIGLTAYFAIIPNIYGKMVPIDWIFTDPQNIIDILRDPNAVLPENHSMIGIRIFGQIWLAGFTASLFFLGKQLHTKPAPDTANAILIKREPYFMIQDIKDALKQVKQQRSNKELDALINAVKRLEEKLSVESDFGYGKGSVINCENNIAKQLQFLLDAAPNIEAGDFDENVRTLNTAVTNVNSLLRRRIELKRVGS